ncbi:hypothetical protein KP15_66 [Klebsiella phage KP15]|uniref:Uncharacterized protein n=1 Tax=Klebsiella phage KP15 TaxID=707757 RepID=D5JFB4_9CAUD|nr:hypothetical protein KP15_66 [Klebsiella phage KP15]ADE34898.1 hypothetical protein KP15_66 [Klebsiella phage KP15]
MNIHNVRVLRNRSGANFKPAWCFSLFLDFVSNFLAQQTNFLVKIAQIFYANAIAKFNHDAFIFTNNVHNVILFCVGTLTYPHYMSIRNHHNRLVSTESRLLATFRPECLYRPLQ